MQYELSDHKNLNDFDFDYDYDLKQMMTKKI